MKTSFFFLVTVSLLLSASVNSQSRFIRNVARDVKSEILGSGSSKPANNTQPEPPCACSEPEVIFSFAGKSMAYNETGIDVLDDGNILIYDKLSGKYYLVGNGKTQGPLSADNPAVAPYINTDGEEETADPLLTTYKQYITKQQGKYLIRFAGKTYGPYAQIQNFMVTKSGDKFAVTAAENIAATEEQGNKMEEAMKKAKTEQEKMELAMKFQQEMMQNMMAGGGPQSITPKLVTNIEGATFNPLTGGTMTAKMKYDDILVNKFTSIADLKGNNIISIKPEHSQMDQVFVSSSNSAYAAYSNGTLFFNDGKSLSELFSPYLIKTGGTVFLAYMYYSPKKNAIVQCKIPF